MSRILAGLVAISLAACASAPPKPAPAKPSASPAPPKPAPGSIGEALLRYRTWITEARAKHPYPETEQRMYDVMICESGGNATIVNKAGPYTGLFQYSDATWNGAWNTYAAEGLTNAKAQIFATALAWSRKMQGQWGCYKKTH